MDRLEALRTLLARNPRDKLARYGLAMEYVKAGAMEEAVAEFRALIDTHPDYAYAYFHAAQALEKAGRIEEARTTYKAGIAAAVRAGDPHARSELQAALDLLG